MLKGGLLTEKSIRRVTTELKLKPGASQARADKLERVHALRPMSLCRNFRSLSPGESVSSADQSSMLG